MKRSPGRKATPLAWASPRCLLPSTLSEISNHRQKPPSGTSNFGNDPDYGEQPSVNRLVSLISIGTDWNGGQLDDDPSRCPSGDMRGAQPRAVAVGARDSVVGVHIYPVKSCQAATTDGVEITAAE